jgi:hypothetical protein
MRWLLLVVLTACGDNAAALVDAPRAVDAGATDSPRSALCVATFSGSFSLSEELPANCAMVSTGSDGTELSFDIAAQPIGSDVAVQIMLASPVPGAYNADSVAQWSATATQVQQGGSRCYYVAGNASVPPGTFTMTLDALGSNTAHGQLSLELAVLAGPATYCGSASVEDLALAF